MRALGSILLGLLIGGVIAATVQLQMAIFFKSGEEFIVAIILLEIIVIGSAALFGITLLVGGGARAVAIVAAALSAVLVVGILGVSIAGKPMLGRDDLVVIGEILIPALIAIVIEWWFVQRHLKKTARLVAAPGK